jgi:hypothetical protein
MRSGLWFLAVLALVVPLFACGAAKKVQECNAVIEKINAAQQSLNTPTSDPTPADLNKVADQLDSLGKDLDAMDISTKELKGFATEYRDISKRLAAAFRKLAKAVEQKDLGLIEAATKEMTAEKAPEAALVVKINGFCQGGS